MDSGWPVAIARSRYRALCHPFDERRGGVTAEHRRAKTDRLDTEMLIRVFLGWLRGEPRHCKNGRDPNA